MKDKNIIHQEDVCDCPHCRARRERQEKIEAMQKAELEKQSSCNCNSSEEMSCCGRVKKDIGKELQKKELTNKLILVLISFAGIVLSFIDIWGLIGLPILRFLDFAYLAVFLNGYEIFKTAILGLKKKKITSSLLVTIAMLASIVLEYVTIHSDHGHSYIFAAGEIAFFMAVGGLIEDWTIGKSRQGIERIIEMTPKTATIKMGSNYQQVSIMQLKVGDVVLVKPNEQIPVDGEIIDGESSVDQSSMTGEFVPVDVKIGDKVYGATYNKHGAIHIKVTVPPQDMTVKKLAALVKEAEGQKAPISRLADKWASYIVPSSIILSVLVGIISYFAFGLTVIEALIRATTILVVFCPCSLTLATPTAVAASLGSAAYNGVVIKSGDAIERLAKINTVAFDKTGTITTGKLCVEKVITFDKIKKQELLFYVGSAEKYSEHPIGKAICEYAKSKVNTLQEPVNTRALVGVGISAKVDGKLVKVVSLKEAKTSSPKSIEISSLDKYADKGYSIVVVFVNFKVIGAICLFDTIRKDCKQIIGLLKQKKYKTIMLTGDNKNSAEYTKSLVEIDEYIAELMPEDKLDAVIKLKQQGNNVLMVGDGVNDAPALAGADASIAMGALGSDVAIETADVAIMNSDVKNVYNTLHLANNTLSTIKRNILISMLINLTSIILSFLGVLTPTTGVLVHNFSSLFVVISSALILKTRYLKDEHTEEEKDEDIYVCAKYDECTKDMKNHNCKACLKHKICKCYLDTKKR